ncbi:MAG: hypothetical protein JWR34_3436 [Mycobacterium sp.]|nr:hypothetical protein [Mycobacterium sp.]
MISLRDQAVSLCVCDHGRLQIELQRGQHLSVQLPELRFMARRQVTVVSPVRRLAEWRVPTLSPPEFGVGLLCSGFS